jgi:threonine/homoserine/homoserine lactone efflux protein
MVALAEAVALDWAEALLIPHTMATKARAAILIVTFFILFVWFLFVCCLVKRNIFSGAVSRIPGSAVMSFLMRGVLLLMFGVSTALREQT